MQQVDADFYCEGCIADVQQSYNNPKLTEQGQKIVTS
jgi:hypothetical protein